ncbi:MAG: hypothetical protein K6F00_05685 [Lachnospiraceae bacterium]|nr:hypothetical protein [Lachnospiraceae bacterium]
MKNKLIFSIVLSAALLLTSGCDIMAAELPGTTEVPTQSAIETEESEEAAEEEPEEEIEEETDTRKKISLDKVKLTSALSYENGKIVLKWSKIKNADRYEVYRSETGKDGFEKLASTKKTKYTDKKTKKLKTYSYKVRAVVDESDLVQESFGKFSKTVEKTCRKAPERSAYLGDSVMSGFGIYGVLGSDERSFAERSLRVNGLFYDILPDVINYHPERVYIMIGTNEVVGNPSVTEIKSRIEKYDDVIEGLYKRNRNVEVVVMGIGPTRNCIRITNSTVKRYNKVLKGICKKHPCSRYYDTTKVLKDSEGRLRGDYAASDGIHWSVSAYKAVYADLKKFMKTW